MKVKLSLIVFFVVNTFCPLSAQNQKDTVYLNTIGDKVSSNVASHYLIKTRTSKAETHEEYDAISGKKLRFSILKKLPPITLDEMVVTGYVVENGQPVSSYKKPFIATYLDSTMLKHGNYMEWYPSGSLKIKAAYEQGRLNGNVETYHSNGKPKQIEVYHLDTLTTGHSFDSLGTEITHVPYFELPQFPKGQFAMYRFFGQLIRYPKNARQSGIQETIFVSFTIDTKGKITNIKTINSQSADLITESIQTVKAMPKWTPARLDGQNIAVTYVLPIKYILE